MDFDSILESATEPEDLEIGLVVIDEFIELNELILALRKDPTNQDIRVRLMWQVLIQQLDFFSTPETEMLNVLTELQMKKQMIATKLSGLK